MSGTSSEARGQGQDLNLPAHIEFFLAARAEGLFLEQAGMLAWESIGRGLGPRRDKTRPLSNWPGRSLGVCIEGGFRGQCRNEGHWGPRVSPCQSM